MAHMYDGSSPISWSGIEELFTDAILPVQWREYYHSHKLAPEASLNLAVLEDALRQLKTSDKRAAHHEAMLWLTDLRACCPVTLRFVCQVLEWPEGTAERIAQKVERHQDMPAIRRLFSGGTRSGAIGELRRRA